MEIALLTSSRADFSFYRPLLNLASKQKKVKFKLVVFGTHLLKEFGYTAKNIEEEGYKIHKKVHTVLKGGLPESVAKSIGEVHIKFSSFWAKNKFDLILCLGDRYEMYAALSASVPFNIPIAHISGGEETLGAIDNYFRNALTHMALVHFTNTKKNAGRVIQLLGHSKNVFHTGSLAIDNINETILYTPTEFKKKFNFNITEPFILFTFHPETVKYEKNKEFAETIKKLLEDMKVPVLVTMPNADTMGNIIRECLITAGRNNKNIFLVESLGAKGYYTAMSYCMFVMGNSSSGIVEAASFKKYAINIGDRQKGRECGKNIIDVEINKNKIKKAIKKINSLPKLNSENIYGNGKAAAKILNILNDLKLKK